MAYAVSDRDYTKDLIRTAMSAPMLDPDEELALAHAWINEGCEESLGKLTHAHMRMAVSAAIKFRGYGLPLGDLIQEGMIGLLEAAKRFDTDREVRFCTYAGWWIRAAMQDYVLRNWSIVRIGSKSAHKTIFFNLGRIRAMIEEADSKGAKNLSKVAERFKVTEDDIYFMTSRMNGKDSSLNATLNEEGAAEHIEMIEDSRDLPDVTAEDVIDQEKRQRLVADALDRLNEREQTIIKQRFFSDDKVTLSSLGVSLGLSKERIRQIEKQAIVKLRHSLSQGANFDKIEEIFAI